MPTDSAPALQAQLNANNVVVIPPGIYAIGSALQLRSDQHLTLEAGAMLQALPTLTKSSLINLAGVSNVTIDGPGIVDGMASNAPTGDRYGILITGACSGIMVRGITVQNVPGDGMGNNWGDGLYIGVPAVGNIVPTDILIDGVTLMANSRVALGITSGKSIKVVNSTIGGSVFGACIDIEANAATAILDNITVGGCELRGSKGGGISTGPGALGVIIARRLVFANNRIHDNLGHAFSLSAMSDAAVTGNVIDQTGSPTEAIYIVDSRRVVVKANTIRGGTWGVHVDQNKPNSGLTRHVSIGGNGLTQQTAGGLLVGASGLIGVNLKNNDIGNDAATAGTVYVGISCMSGTNVTGNVLSLQLGHAGIATADTASPGAVIMANVLRGDPATSISVPSGSPHTVQGNVTIP